MANPLYGQNKADAAANVVAVIHAESPALSGANQKYITIPFDCYVRKVYYQLNTAITTGASTLVLKNEGTVMTGGGSMPVAAIGTGGLASTLTANNFFNAGDVMEIENDATPDAGQATFYVICETA